MTLEDKAFEAEKESYAEGELEEYKRELVKTLKGFRRRHHISLTLNVIDEIIDLINSKDK